MNQSNFKKILVIKHGSLGDIVFSLEPMMAIHSTFSQSTIDIVTESKFLPLFRKMSIFNKYLVDNRSGFFTTASIIYKIITGKYDLIIDLQNSKRTNLYHFFVRLFSKVRINGSKSFSHDRYSIPLQGEESPTQGLFNQLKLININKSEFNFAWLEEDMTSLDLENKKVVLVIPGVSKSGKYKQWPSANYRDLCLYLESKGYHICLVGTKYDVESTSPILNVCKNTINLIDKSPPEIIYSVAKKSNLIISNDTGPGHIAALSNVNTLWLALDNKITKSNLSYRKNSYLLLKDTIKKLGVEEVKDFISIKSLLDKV